MGKMVGLPLLPIMELPIQLTAVAGPVALFTQVFSLHPTMVTRVLVTLMEMVGPVLASLTELGPIVEKVLLQAAVAPELVLGGQIAAALLFV
jgi:hypothetical protein